MGDSIAGVIVEPVAGNMGVVPATEPFLKTLRTVTSRHGALLIFDEVITGFRVGYGGAQHVFGVEPDLTCLGKIVGGGMPMGVYGGKEEIMGLVSPAGPVYQAGTLAGNPLAMAAGVQTLKLLARPGTYEKLEHHTDTLCRGLREGAAKAGVPVQTSALASMFSVFFTSGEVTNYEDVKGCDTHAFAAYFTEMLRGGVYLPPSQFEANFLSTTHDAGTVEFTTFAAEDAFCSVVRTQRGKDQAVQ
jgi:glutamate-1-semialdehyde 2,1-aminomutase